MAKDCDDLMYGCMDELAIFCCFTRFLDLQAKLPFNKIFKEGKTTELLQILPQLLILVDKLCNRKTLSGLSAIVNPLLDLVLQGEVTVEDLKEFTE